MDKIQSIELEMIKEVERISKQHNLRYYLAYGSVIGAIRHNGFIPWDSDIDIVVFIDHYDFFCETIKSNIGSRYKLNNYMYDSNYDSLKARVFLNGQDHTVAHIDIFPIVGAPENSFLKFTFSKLAYLNYRGYFVKKVNANNNYKYNRRKRYLAKLLKVFTKLIPDKIFTGLHNKLSLHYPLSKSTEVFNICGSYGLKEFFPKDWFGDPEYIKFETLYLPVPERWDDYLKHIYGDYMTPKKENYV